MLKTTEKQRSEIKDKIQNGNLEKNEKVWNFLCGNILAEAENRQSYVRKFTNESIEFEDKYGVFFESKPLPPRESEGNTQLDLALGSIQNRGSTKSGIEFDNRGDWVCFVEGKLFADCSSQVRHDPIRNQLIRVIENLLCFQKNGDFPDEVYFTLLTPRIFKENKKTKLYGYKMQEYRNEGNILKDIRSCRLEKRYRDNWEYPDIEERLRKLELGWVTYEEILEQEHGLEGLDVTDLDEEELEFFKEQMMEWMNSVGDS